MKTEPELSHRPAGIPGASVRLRLVDAATAEDSSWWSVSNRGEALSPLCQCGDMG